MMTFPCNAIVILGYSGVGKDTLANMLAEDIAEVVNAKFGAFNKEIVATLFKVPATFLDDHEWRTTAKLVVAGKISKVTAFDLLTALFRGSKGTPLEQEHLQHTLSLCKGCIPVFTDIRRITEFDAVIENYNPLVIYLSRANVVTGTNDHDIPEVWRYAQGCPRVITHLIYAPEEETPEQTYARFAKLVSGNVVTKFTKPTLHIYVSKNFEHALTSTLRSALPSYEPLGKLASSLAKIGIDFGIDVHGYNEMFNAAIFNMNFEKLEIAPIECSSSMVWHQSHEHFLPQLRQKAILRVHVMDDESAEKAKILFTSKELSWI